MLRNVGLLPLLVALAAPGQAAPAGNGTPRDHLLVSTAWLAEHQMDKNLVLLHVGEREEFDRAHIPGARYTSFDDISTPHEEEKLMLELPDAESLRHNLEMLGISDTSRIVVYFGKDWVTPATRMLFTLDAAGLGERSSLLDGGMPAWVRGGHPTTAEPTAPKPGELTPFQLRPLVVAAPFVASHLDAPGFAVVDARSAVFYDGVRQGGDPQSPHRRGHIAGAGSVPYGAIADDELKLRPADELRALFEKAGVAPGDTVIAYCHIGQQATAVVFAARTLGLPALLYDGSFEDWSARPELPVEAPPPAAP